MLHLAAFDAEDLSSVSLQMQDAVLRLSELTYLPKRRQVALVANRFAWDALPDRQRRRCGLRINDVKSARKLFAKSLGQDTILSLLAITFAPDAKDTDGLGGTLTLSFSGGHGLALDVDCIDVQLDDLGPAWGTGRTPSHDTRDDEPGA